LEFNIPFQHKYGYIRDEIITTQMLRGALYFFIFVAEVNSEIWINEGWSKKAHTKYDFIFSLNSILSSVLNQNSV